MKSFRFPIVPLLVLLLAGAVAAQIPSPASFALLISPREVSLNHGEGVKFEAGAFGLHNPLSTLVDYKWRVEPDSLGRITEDGFFIAGRYDGEATIICEAEFGFPRLRLLARARVFIGRLHDPKVKVIVTPENAVVPPGASQPYRLTFVTAANDPVLDYRVKWTVEPRHLGEITQDGLFTAGPAIGQGQVIAYVEIRGELFRGAARVTVADEPTSIISGQVTDAVTGLPISSAGVWAELVGAIQWRVDARVDSNGHYVLRRLIPGLYVVKADARKYLPEFYQEKSHFDEANPVPVAANDSIPDIDFTLSPGGTIAGFVGTDGDSSALAGAHVLSVLAVEPHNFRKWRHAVTDENGHYEVATLAPGSYVVSADAPGYKPEFFDDAQEFGEADPVTIDDIETEDGIDFYLAMGSAIAGNVSDANGEPIARAVVRLLLLSSNYPRYIREVRTDDNGDYIAEARPGKYFVFAAAEKYLGEFFKDAREFAEADTVEVVENTHTTGIDFELSALSTISGKVVDAITNDPLRAVVFAFPEPGTNVDPTRAPIHSRFPLAAKTDSLGNYAIENVKPGKYFVRAEADDYLPEFWKEADSLADADAVEITESTSASGIDFTLEKGGAISGTVFDEADTTGIQGAVVKVWSATGNAIRRAVTDAHGNYRVSGLRTGDYYVFAKAEGYEGEFFDGATDRSGAQLVHVDAGNETSGIDFYLNKFQSRFGSISGVVGADVDGTPLSDAFVLAVPLNPGQAFFDLTDRFGFYRLNGLFPGNYIVLAWAPGYVGEFYKDARTWAEATPVAVAANAETAGIDFGLASSPHGPYRIAGRLRRAGGNQGVANAAIYAVTEDGHVSSTVTNPDGSFALDAMAAGTYKLMASTPESPAAFFGGANFETATSVIVDDGQSASNLDFEVQGATGIADTDTETIPSAYGLAQNFPNPFNPETTIKYQLPSKSEVNLRVFNMLGQEVATLVNATQAAGVHRVQWNGTDKLGQKVATGIYLFRLDAGAFSMTRKMIVVK